MSETTRSVVIVTFEAYKLVTAALGEAIKAAQAAGDVVRFGPPDASTAPVFLGYPVPQQIFVSGPPTPAEEVDPPEG